MGEGMGVGRVLVITTAFELGENALFSLGLNCLLTFLAASARLGEGVLPPAAGSSPSSHAPHPLTEST
jgi:hypothetical protein